MLKKLENFFAWIHDPQISNQIDVYADVYHLFSMFGEMADEGQAFLAMAEESEGIIKGLLNSEVTLNYVLSSEIVIRLNEQLRKRKVELSARPKTSKLTGASIPPKPMMHLSPISDFPPLFRIFHSLGKYFPTNREKCMLHPPKFLITFFSH